MNKGKFIRAFLALDLVACGYGLAVHYHWIGVPITAAIWIMVLEN